MTKLEIAWTALTAAGALMGWLFVIRYALAPRRRPGCRRPGCRRLRRWWRSATGWNLMVFTTLIAIAFTLLALDQLLGPFPRVAWLAVVAGIDLTIWHRLLLIFADDRTEEP